MTTTSDVDATPTGTGRGIARPHGPLAKAFHWGFIAVFAYAIYKQLNDVSQLSDMGLLQFEVVFAGLFLLLLGARYVYMRYAGPTSLPDDTPVLVRTLARGGHLAMYASLAMIAISGLMIGGLYAAGITAGPAMALVLGLHEVSVMASYIFIGIHVAAAIFHRLKGDGIWSSMVPFWTERRG